MPHEFGPDSPNWFSRVEAAERVAAPDQVAWDISADFVVVGYGGAGVSAALQAAENGLKVLAVDAFGGGGATAMNGGIFYSGGGTVVQRKAGVEDTVDNMYRYLREEVKDVVSPSTLQRFCAGSSGDLDWLIGHGVRFDSSYYPHKTFYPPSGYFLYHPDSTLAAVYQNVARPAPRGHKYWHPPVNQAVGFGIHLTEPLQRRAASLGVEFWPRTEARRMIVSTEGEILGVAVMRIPPDSPYAREFATVQETARTLMQKLPSSMPGYARHERKANRYWRKADELLRMHGVLQRIRATRGVCLSAGGFIWNRQMVASYAPKYVAGMAMGSPGGDNGSGIRLGQTAGGKADLMERVSSWRFINPPTQWPKGILVNATGRRYVNEALYGATIGRAMNEHNNGKGYIILDRALYRGAWREAALENLFPFMRIPLVLALGFQTRKGRTLADLARKLNIPEAELSATVARYNRIADGLEDDEFGKGRAECHALREGPFYAVDVSVSSKLFPCCCMSVGGLRVNEDSGQVLREDGSPVSGLYAAGRTAIGLPSNLYVSGLSAADCVFSGRRAANHASRRSFEVSAEATLG
ncbi:FAD-binding protein [Paraburkholderia sp. HP33-1]|uniref:FAD-binding protein n=1 Tax=Paraburkholderia sp. HP33-1 TaxID=2883243 RepID=UPI001F1F8771|nr:FAD-binding protein [Paraburkholderia sp. HP33-1]